nr:Uncharacterised protein [Klebsiella pneumoniae]
MAGDAKLQPHVKMRSEPDVQKRHQVAEQFAAGQPAANLIRLFRGQLQQYLTVHIRGVGSHHWPMLQANRLTDAHR